MQINLKSLIKECVFEILKENLSNKSSNINIKETNDGEACEQYKKYIYAELEKLRFYTQGTDPRDFMEYYMSGFATVGCSVNTESDTVFLERYYDSERLDMMPGNHIEKTIKLPATYSQEWADKIVLACKRMQDAVKGDESLFGGMDESNSTVCSSCNGSGEGMHDGTKCASCGGSGTEGGYKKRLNKRTDPDYEEDETMDENSAGTIYKDRQGGSYVYWIDNKDNGGKINISPEKIGKYIRQGYHIIELDHDPRASRRQPDPDMSNYMGDGDRS